MHQLHDLKQQQTSILPYRKKRSVETVLCTFWRCGSVSCIAVMLDGSTFIELYDIFGEPQFVVYYSSMRNLNVDV